MRQNESLCYGPVKTSGSVGGTIASPVPSNYSKINFNAEQCEKDQFTLAPGLLARDFRQSATLQSSPAVVADVLTLFARFYSHYNIKSICVTTPTQSVSNG